MLELPKTIEPAIDPANKISFLLDWEITLRCNLDCSYCSSEWHIVLVIPHWTSV